MKREFVRSIQENLDAFAGKEVLIGEEQIVRKGRYSMGIYVNPDHASFKKAVVKLAADSKEIEFFQGM